MLISWIPVLLGGKKKENEKKKGGEGGEKKRKKDAPIGVMAMKLIIRIDWEDELTGRKSSDKNFLLYHITSFFTKLKWKGVGNDSLN